MRAYDTAYPSETATATVNIGVSRNENSPLFGQNPYRVTINETVGVGTCILDVDATDADGVSLNYIISLNLSYSHFMFWLSLTQEMIKQTCLSEVP